jgi:carnitine O-acetyltransferase
MNSNGSQELATDTFGNEDRLPRVPLPTLQDSCARLLEWCAPLLSADELAETEAAVNSFLRPDSPAHELQAELERYNFAEGVHSWLDTFWPRRYLGRRDRIALNANFFFLFAESDATQTRRAAGLIAGALNYKLKVDEESFPPAVQRGVPMTMEQNKFLFSSTRIPGAEQDTSRTPYSEEWPGPSKERHIVVFLRGNMFRLEVIGPSGRPYTVDELEAGLRAVLDAGTTDAAASPGHLTTKARAEWAASRQALKDCDTCNADLLDEIETALFCVCLEHEQPADTQAVCARLLAGNSGNRWFDKAVSLIVFPDGAAGINVEHCNLDGTTILTFTDFVLGESEQEHSRQSGAESQGVPEPRAIEFALDDGLRADIGSAAAAFAEFAGDTAGQLVSFQDFGSDRAKQLGMSPDAFVQMAYQLAHRRAKGFTGATYESIATRQYHHGRTEAMRVVTPEVLDFVATMEDPGTDRAARLAAFKAAADKHVARAKESQAIQAPEQHLWELQLIHQRRGGAEPLPLYETPGWQKMRSDYMSTSSAPSTNIQYFGFGSTSSQCIGVAYVLLPDRLNVHLSTPRPVADAMFEFAGQLRVAIGELQSLLSTG